MGPEFLSDLSLLDLPERGPVEPASDSGGEADTEETAMLAAAANTQRPRGEGTRWQGKLRVRS